MRGLLVLLLSAGAALVPGAAAQDGEELCIIFVTPSPSFATVEIRVDLVLGDSDRANATSAADLDGDGAITRDEVVAWEESTRETHDGSAAALGDKAVQLDWGFGPRATIVMDATGLEGPADPSREDFAIAEVRTYDFQASSRRANAHLLEGGQASDEYPRVAIETLVVSAPEGWHVARVNQVEYAERNVTVQGVSLRERFSIEFLKDGVPEDKIYRYGEPPRVSPGPPVVALGFALLAVAAARKLGTGPRPPR